MTKQNVYLSNKEHNLVSLDNVNLKRDVMLLDAGCGYGKTTFILDGNSSEENIKFLELLNDKRKEQGMAPTTYRRILIATSRKITLEQMRSDTDLRLFGGKKEAEARTNPFNDENQMDWIGGNRTKVNEEDIPQITTFAKLSIMIKKGYFDSEDYDMIVIDEAHTLILDSTFADDTFYLLKWLETDEKVMKLFMTGTPFIWEKFVAENENLADKYKFKTINKPLEPKYQSDKVNFHFATTLDSILKNYLLDNTFDENNKCLAFSSSASGAVRYMVNDPSGRTMALVSVYTDKEITLSEEQEDNIKGWVLEGADQANRKRLFEKMGRDKKVKILDVMNLRRSWIDRIINEGMLPNEAILLLATSAYREGISILDKRLKYMGSEFPDEASLRQAIARGRHNDLSEIFIVLNGNYRNKLAEQKEDLDEFLNKYKTLTNDDLKEEFKMVRHEAQKTPLSKGNEKVKIVVEVKETLANGEIKISYELNHYLYVYYTYMEYHFAVNDNTTATTKEIDSEGYVVSETKTSFKNLWTGENLPTWKEYFSDLLAPYSREKKVNFISGNELRKDILSKEIENNNTQKAATLDELVKAYVGMKITSDIKKEIVAIANEIGLMRSSKKKVGWTTIKGEIGKLGYTVKDKKSGSLRYSIIEEK